MNHLGKRLINLRVKKGYSQEQLAKKSNVSLRTIQRIEKNETYPRKSTLSLICDVLEVSTTDLATENLNKNNYITLVANYFFLIVFNVALMGMIGFLTLDQSANINSRFGGILISFFIPICIVFFTQKMSSGERLLKYGIGYITYILLCFVVMGFGKAWIIGINSFLLPCLIISVLTLFYGDRLLPKG